MISLACVHSFDMGVPNVGSAEVLEAVVTLVKFELVVEAYDVPLET